jgi:hypothetical protein
VEEHRVIGDGAIVKVLFVSATPVHQLRVRAVNMRLRHQGDSGLERRGTRVEMLIMTKHRSLGRPLCIEIGKSVSSGQVPEPQRKYNAEQSIRARLMVPQG